MSDKNEEGERLLELSESLRSACADALGAEHFMTKRAEVLYGTALKTHGFLDEAAAMLFSGTAAVLAKRFYKAHMAGDTYGVEQAEAACRAALEAEEGEVLRSRSRLAAGIEVKELASFDSGSQETEQLTQLCAEILQVQGKTQEAAELVTGYGEHERL